MERHGCNKLKQSVKNSSATPLLRQPHILQKAARLPKEGPADYQLTWFDPKMASNMSVKPVPFPMQPYGTCQLAGGDLRGTRFLTEPAVGSSTNSLEEKQEQESPTQSLSGATCCTSGSGTSATCETAKDNPDNNRATNTILAVTETLGNFTTPCARSLQRPP